MDQRTTQQAVFRKLQRPATNSGRVSDRANGGPHEQSALQLLVDLFQNRNFLTFSHIEAVTGLPYSEVICLKQALIAALGVDVTSRIDLGGFFVEH
jgi:hypothetical protein